MAQLASLTTYLATINKTRTVPQRILMLIIVYALDNMIGFLFHIPIIYQSYARG